MLYRIKWKSKITGNTEFGEYNPNRYNLEELIKEAEKNFPEIIHEIEEKVEV